jgi:D-alanyl-D-alanine dipeptidase
MNKIIHHFRLFAIYAIVFLLIPRSGNAQDTILNKYGLWVIDNCTILQRTVKKNAGKQMADVKQKIPTVIIDLKYAGTDNFMHQKLYPPTSTTYLRKCAADALAKVQLELHKKGLGLKIFDAYRPYSVTEKMWEPVKDDRYAADPKKGSGHNRGIAVDLTIIDLRTKKELDMGTGFDNFSDTAHHAFTNLLPAVLKNRLLLKGTMERFGFKALDTEWWHYFLVSGKDFELLDVSFAELNGLN